MYEEDIYNSGYCCTCRYCNRLFGANSLKPPFNSHKLQATNTPLVTEYHLHAVVTRLLVLLLMTSRLSCSSSSSWQLRFMCSCCLTRCERGTCCGQILWKMFTKNSQTTVLFEMRCILAVSQFRSQRHFSFPLYTYPHVFPLFFL